MVRMNGVAVGTAVDGVDDAVSCAEQRVSQMLVGRSVIVIVRSHAYQSLGFHEHHVGQAVEDPVGSTKRTGIMAAIGGFDIGSHRLDGDAVSSIFGNAIAVATAFLYAFIIGCQVCV